MEDGFHDIVFSEQSFYLIRVTLMVLVLEEYKNLQSPKEGALITGL